MPILSAKNLLLRIGANAPLLDNVCFDIEAGDRICLVGRNGCGKSTLLKVLTDEMEVQSGEVIKKSGLRISRMIQEIPAHMEGTVRDVVMEPLLLSGTARTGGSGEDGADEGLHNAHAEAVLGKTGIDADALFDSLSGGQKRRVLFARALAQDPDLLLLDEPVAGLDPKVTEEMYEIISSLSKNDGITIIMITHV